MRLLLRDRLDLEGRTVNAFEHHWSSVVAPFEWRFTRDDLERLLKRLSVHEPELQQAA